MSADSEDMAPIQPAGASLNGVSLNGVSLNGVSLNGVSLNGVSLNGVSLNGVSLNGVSLNGVSLNGVSLNGVSLNGTVLAGLTTTGQVVTGTDFVGAALTASLSDGQTIELRIESAAAGAGGNADVWTYGVSYRTVAGWSPLCGVDLAGAPQLAVPVSGRFDTRSGVPGGGSFTADPAAFTFSCRGGAIAKCVELGYKPWQTVAGVNLQDHLLACTRLLRADFCADGTSYTVDGTEVNVYDDLGVQGDTKSWRAEAEWTADGARCMAPGTPARVQKKVHRVPPCHAHLVQARCGAPPDYDAGTLLVSETQAP
jgi:uncharacterized protein YjbI with pentapeptide repeats